MSETELLDVYIAERHCGVYSNATAPWRLSTLRNTMAYPCPCPCPSASNAMATVSYGHISWACYPMRAALDRRLAHGLESNVLCKQLATMARMIPDALEAVVEDARTTGVAGIDEVGAGMIEEINANCKRYLEGYATKRLS